MFFLDTNTCIYFLNGQSENIRRKILALPPSEIAIPVIVKAELVLSSFKSRTPEKTREKVEKFMEPFEVIPLTDPVSYTYGEIRSYLEGAGMVIGPNDLWIASLAKFHGATLVTRNVQEFSRIPGLYWENWF